MRQLRILSYLWQAVYEDSCCDLNYYSNESHILIWASWCYQEDLSHITHWISVCSHFTWSDIWLSACHTHSDEDDSQEASQYRMTFIHHLYCDLLSQTADDHCTADCRDFFLMKQFEIDDWHHWMNFHVCWEFQFIC